MPTADLFSRGLALLAFVMAFYALAARERKTPYLVHSIYAIVWFVFASMILSLFAPVATRYRRGLGQSLEALASWVLGVGVFYVIVGVWKAYNRHANFRDDNLLKNLRLVRWAKSRWRDFFPGPTYEHDPIKFPPQLTESLKKCAHIDSQELAGAFVRNENSISATGKVKTFEQADRILVDLAIRFLEQDCWVQYTVCSRHPINFVDQLRKTWASDSGRRDWNEIANRVIVVDAYTPHFGFTDSIYEKRTKELRTKNVQCHMSRATYAGIHTASAKAFNTIKSRHKDPLRQPTLVIYEGPYALVDLESLEQYRIFVRHVVPSERLWAGMFTVVIEGEISDEHFETLSLYCDIKFK